MKVARKETVAFDLYCPECDMPHDAPRGSSWWTKEEIELADKVRTCAHCDSKFKMPSISAGGSRG